MRLSAGQNVFFVLWVSAEWSWEYMVVDLSPANIAAVLEKAIGTSYVPLEWTSVQLRMMLNVVKRVLLESFYPLCPFT